MKNMDLTKGAVFKTLCVFALPMILGNMLQQGYNIVDTWVVGKFIGSDALERLLWQRLRQALK